MVAEHPPFTYARPNDTYYKCISSNRSDLYWRLVSKGHEDDENFFSPDFKDLITSMIQIEPNHRPTMSEIYEHPWVNGPLPSDVEIRNEIK